MNHKAASLPHYSFLVFVVADDNANTSNLLVGVAYTTVFNFYDP